MSLEKAIRGMVDDRATESLIRQVLETLRRHPGQWVTTDTVAHVVDQPDSVVGVILSRLAGGSVLVSDGERYRYDIDPVVELDVKGFLNRSEKHERFAQHNLERFRDRYGRR